MSQLFGILFKAKNFLLFLFLQMLCFILIRYNNIKWDVTLFNSSNLIAGSTMESTKNAKEYLSLKEVNKDLAEENIILRQRLTLLEESQSDIDATNSVDSLFASRFNYTLAKVANSTIGYTKNYITLNKGKADGIEPGMGVIGPRGIVGQVMNCGEHFSRVYSVLHVDFNVSSEIHSEALSKSDYNALGVSKWDAESHRKIKLTTIDKFKPVSEGDTVFTSTQNLIFPSGIMVGRISQVADDPQKAFWDLTVDLSTDFTGLSYVYVVANKLTSDQETVETSED